MPHLPIYRRHSRLQPTYASKAHLSRRSPRLLRTWPHHRSPQDPTPGNIKPPSNHPEHPERTTTNIEIPESRAPRQKVNRAKVTHHLRTRPYLATQVCVAKTAHRAAQAAAAAATAIVAIAPQRTNNHPQSSSKHHTSNLPTRLKSSPPKPNATATTPLPPTKKAPGPRSKTTPPPSMLGVC